VILAFALALDLAAGEPPNRWHPVAWIGRWLGWLFPMAPGRSAGALLAWGTGVVIGTTALVWVAASVIHAAFEPLGLAGAVLEAAVLKGALSLRGLADAAQRVGRLLVEGDLGAARTAVGLHLVSRDTTELDAAGVASATVESVAENLTDGVVAPVLFYLAFGLPGAWAYRVVNTADAMVGYRAGAHEHLGKAAARLDDLANLVPARIAGLALVAGAALVRADARGAFRTMCREHARTASPNAGWTMAAMAGALGVTLEKRGHYRLGEGPRPDADTILRSIRVMGVAAGVVVVGALLASVLARR
jgi:adenosylcobinamide-phosphate synthase